MSKKVGLKETLKKPVRLARKLSILTQDSPHAQFDIEKAVKNIHTATSKDKQYRLSIDAPENVYEEIKIKVARQRTTVRDYVLDLIRNDLSK